MIANVLKFDRDFQQIVNGSYSLIVELPFPPTDDFLTKNTLQMEISDADGYFVKVNKTFTAKACPPAFGFDGIVRIFNFRLCQKFLDAVDEHGLCQGCDVGRYSLVEDRQSCHSCEEGALCTSDGVYRDSEKVFLQFLNFRVCRSIR